MPIASNQNLESNLLGSVEAFLYTNVVQPYNTAVATTTFPQLCTIIIEIPDDPSVIATPPVIAMCLPEDYKPYDSVGMGDREVWAHKVFNMKVYPSMSEVNGVYKPSITSAGYLRSLITQITTALTVPLYDYSSGSPVLEDVAYIDAARLMHMHGAMSMLAIDKHRFDYQLKLRFPLLTLNG